MASDKIDKLYKNYDILSDAKEKIIEVRSRVQCYTSLQTFANIILFDISRGKIIANNWKVYSQWKILSIGNRKNSVWFRQYRCIQNVWCPIVTTNVDIMAIPIRYDEWIGNIG